MAESSRRADRGGLANALFVVAAAERIPPALRGAADELTTQFPWGSLLRGALALDDAGAAAAGIAALLKPQATATALLSIEARDGLGLPRLDDPRACEALRERWLRHGLDVYDLRPATADELARTRSTWARRLGAGRDRATWRVALRRRAGPPDAVEDAR
jgi:16S rRNA (adenine(1408)-N(1))-methyltransferase